MIIHNMDQHSEAWYSIRCGKVTGTRFKDLVAGESTAAYKNLITNLACEMITGKQEEGYSNALMESALELEPEARKEYEYLFDIEVQECGFITPDEDNIFHEWIGISPDGIIPDLKGMLEIKCPLARTHFEYIESGKLPSEYRYQVQGQLFVTGYDYCDFMSYVKGMKPFVIRVYPDQELFKEFERRLAILIELVKIKLETYKRYDYYE